MRILFADQFSDLGGAQQCLLDAVRAALELGWTCSVVLPEEGPLAYALRRLDVTVERIRCGPYQRGYKTIVDFVRYGREALAQKAAFARLLEANTFDLLYVNGPRLLPAGARAAHRRIPVLFHAHNHLAQRYAAQLVGRALRADEVTVAACSRFAAQPLLPFVAPDRLHLIPNGVPDMGYRRRRTAPDRPWRIGVLGRVALEKGQLIFVKAANTLLPRLPVDTRFVICGSAGTENQEYFEHLRRTAGSQQIEFLPWQENVEALLSGLDLLVVPSATEGMPRVILEAFSAGLPVLAFAAGGIPEVIRDRETGFLVSEPSVEGLACRISELLADPEQLQRVATNARRAWEVLYDVRIYRRRITELMELAVRGAEPETGTPRRRAHTA